MVPCCMIDFCALKFYTFCHFIRLRRGHMAKEPKYSPREDDPEMYRLVQWSGRFTNGW